jgi:transcriptional regulator with PAS, ATPase and Fis domain
MLKNGETVICNRLPIRDETGAMIGVLSMAIFKEMDQINQLHTQIKNLQNSNRLYRQQLTDLKQDLFSLVSIVGDSPRLKKIKDTIEKAAASKLCVLLTGETGTGKNVLANAVHQLSGRRLGNFVKVNCAAIPHDLLESELFGYTEGAFTGAAKGGKIGKFELANHGTILLDEIAELPLGLQSKLLQVLQENELEKIGGTKPAALDIRVISCTNQNIEAMVNAGTFRRDLYYRINTIEIDIPPLREHPEDIPLLCSHLIKKINQRHDCYIEGVSDSMLDNFAAYHWPGNVRELEHVLERASVMTFSGVLSAPHFEFFLTKISQKGCVAPFARAAKTADALPPLAGAVESAERDAIVSALRTAGGNKSKTAVILNVSRSALYAKFKKYGIK